MDGISVVKHCSAKIENFAKYKFTLDHIVWGIAYNRLSYVQINNLIKTSGLSSCDIALLRKDLNERINPLGRV